MYYGCYLDDLHPLIDALLSLLIHSPWSVGALEKMDPSGHLDPFVQAVHDPEARKKIWEEQPRFKHVVNLFE